MINRGGEKVYPREIEEVVGADPAVVAAAVVGRDDPNWVRCRWLSWCSRASMPRAIPQDGVTRGRSGSDAALAPSPGPRRGEPVALHVVAALPAGATGQGAADALCCEPGHDESSVPSRAA